MEEKASKVQVDKAHAKDVASPSKVESEPLAKDKTTSLNQTGSEMIKTQQSVTSQKVENANQTQICDEKADKKDK